MKFAAQLVIFALVFQVSLPRLWIKSSGIISLFINVWNHVFFGFNPLKLMKTEKFVQLQSSKRGHLYSCWFEDKEFSYNIILLLCPMNMTLTPITSTIVTTSLPTVLIVIGHYCKLEHDKRDDTGGSDAADRRTVEACTGCRCCCVWKKFRGQLLTITTARRHRAPWRRRVARCAHAHLFTTSRDLHTYNTRQRHQYRRTSHRLELATARWSYMFVTFSNGFVNEYNICPFYAYRILY